MSVWSLVYEGFDPDREGLREALCTLGNGYFCTRGAGSEASDDEIHYPGTYLAGGYNRLKTTIAGEDVENEDLVNMPNWLPLTFRIADGPWFGLQSFDILSYRQELDLKHGLLRRWIRFQDGDHRRTHVETCRLVHMGMPHFAAQELRLTPENWSGKVEIHTALDGLVVNNNVARYSALNSKHLDPLETASIDEETIFLQMQTNQSKICVAQAARTCIFEHGRLRNLRRRTEQKPGYIAQKLQIEALEGVEIRIEKVVAFFTSKDTAIGESGLAARTWVARAGSFAELRQSHEHAWEMLWRRFDMQFEHKDQEESDRIGEIVHLYIFHLLQTTSVNTMTMQLDAGVPSRGWHGEAYRGHILWDELFIFPFINFRLPEITRALLMYRYRRLNEARANAQAAGYRGAMFPWQSGSSGREESQKIHLNPQSGRWIPDNSNLQRHVNAAVAYNVYRYYQITQDNEFLSFYGAELILEIARFWASISSYNPELDCYEILQVMGPDEFHTAYPDANQPGLNNNAYTNIMAVWVLNCARDVLSHLPEDVAQELRSKIGLSDEELAQWDEVRKKIRIVFHDDGIISQFEGYGELKKFNWQSYLEKYDNIQRLDRILEAENDTPNRYQASKQADVLMLFYLFSSEELAEIFGQLGYPFEYETIPRNIDYYLRRVSHGSTLSWVVHAWVLARSDRVHSWRLFHQALQSDVVDIQGGTTPEGIHLGAMAGTIDILQRGYTGIVTRGDVLWFNPALPEGLKRLRMQIRYRGYPLDIEMRPGYLKVTARRNVEKPITIGFKDQTCELTDAESREFRW
ncbi:MAG TPA: glycosyl hydrolase family 65 protein [Thermodesulfobacteriota bacterium]|nr:glycosyl hydrolase family 65 protein [Thermodesulfobacteriota bacterium]HNU72434.1 glycosyl hydrolase family 65 protein [Thermodesulfobacteriota bacterium]HQO77218.1 glycosyl hydrolase family 65 protein [Thermodesulfobacteriota bacterium]